MKTDKCDSCGFELPGERPENVTRRRCGECYVRENENYGDKELDKLLNRRYPTKSVKQSGD